jgi:DNA mismatch repair protein MutL
MTIPRIRRLPEMLANQIAAGEVVERPASVVKELVENSLDAGAAHVSIDIARGGLDAIRVTDDGHGIHPDDLLLALDRHATSKITRAEDLAAIRSLGFRGEALPSIASVARLCLVSRIAAEDSGRELRSAPGESAPRVGPAAHPVGTTVEISALFHNVPARRRFLRSGQTEYLHILDVARRLALSRQSLSLRLAHDGRVALNARADSEPRLRLQQVLGRAVEAAAQQVDYAAMDMRLSGWACDPEFHRSQSDLQLLFLNGRSVRDRQLAHAVRVAYGDAVPPGRFPVYVLCLELDPAAADVNVHPTKHEVRFRRARDVHDFVSSGVRAALGLAPGVHGVAEAPASWARSNSLRGRSFPEARGTLASFVESPAAEAASGVATAFLVGDRFIVMRHDGALRIVDALVLCREVFQRRLLEGLRGGGVPTRPLLVPLRIPVTAEEAEKTDTCLEAIAGAGFVLSRSAPAEITVREFPVTLGGCPLVPWVKALLRIIRAGNAKTPETILRQLCASLPETTPVDLGLRPLLDMLREQRQRGAGAHVAGLERELSPDELGRLLAESRAGG